MPLRRSVYLAAAFTLIAGNALAAEPVTVELNDTHIAAFTFPEGEWVEYYNQVAPEAGHVIQYIPKEESIANWSRMVTILGRPTPVKFQPEMIIESVKALSKQICPKVEYDVLEQVDEGDTTTMTMQTYCPLATHSSKAERTIYRYVFTPHFVGVVQYATRGMGKADLPENAAQWVARTAICRKEEKTAEQCAALLQE